MNGETGATVGTVDVSDTTHTDAGTYNNDPGASRARQLQRSERHGRRLHRQGERDGGGHALHLSQTTYTGIPHTATVTSITGVNGETGATVGTVDVSGTTHTDAGTYNADHGASLALPTTTTSERHGQRLHRQGERGGGGDALHLSQTTYNGIPHTATVTSITGVNGETGATVGTVDVSNTTHTNAGTYNTDHWSFTGTANYNDIAARRSPTASPRRTRWWW